MTEMIPVLDVVVQRMLAKRIRGSTRLRRLLGKVCTTKEVTYVTSFGSRLLLRPDEYIDSFILREGYYESEVISALLENLPHESIVWDVGANFGLHAVTAAKLRPDLKVICFEPCPEQAARILFHAELNDVTVEVFCVGLSDRTGYATLYKVKGNPGMNTTVPWEKASYSSKISCCLDTGDRLVDSGTIAAPHAIKMDIEGGEAAALVGMATILSSRIKRIVFEGGDDLASLVESYGFSSVRKLARREASHHALANFCAENL
jgi:FkbM family methyltransferase